MCDCLERLISRRCVLLEVVAGASSKQASDPTDLGPGNWDSCKEGAGAPPTRVNTRDRVNVIRSYFSTANIEAYIVPSEDAHQSEYVADYDKRRGYISGFQGSAGFAVITIDKAALWTDGRYFLEAEATLDCNWILMRNYEPGVPTMVEWLKKELRSDDAVGVNPSLVGSDDWKKYREELGKAGIRLVQTYDLIDNFWFEANGRPERPDEPINALPLQFAGLSWQDKLGDVREKMAKKDVDMLIVTGLDETAWLFNLRGNDIDYNPFFLSYAIVDKNQTRLYLYNYTRKLTEEPTDPQTKVTVAEHLNTNADGSCEGRTGECVQVTEYNPRNVAEDIRVQSMRANKVWLGYSCSYAIYFAVGNETKIHQDNTPIETTKMKKNAVEVEGMKNSHTRDAVALISFLAKLEKEVKAGKKWTELSAAEDLEAYRRAQKYNRGLSFKSISASGPNGAIIHYRPSAQTDRRITTKELYLLDSGAQYLDGTTDVTRTMHFGTPTDFEKECYTRVLLGHINLFLTKWPKGLYGREIDAFARGPLWDVGLIYRHGTGHGIGMYLSVHEGPARISLSHKRTKGDSVLDEHQFFSDGPAYMTKSHRGATKLKHILDEFLFISNEPGFYDDGKFGIRLENIVMVKNATTKYHFPGTQFLTFDHVTLVPYDPGLINVDMLSHTQIDYLNDYNQRVRDQIGPELKKQGKMEGYDWMMKKTQPISKKSNVSSGTSSLTFAQLSLLPLLVLYSLLKL